jgi:hypothetical protein
MCVESVSFFPIFVCVRVCGFKFRISYRISHFVKSTIIQLFWIWSLLKHTLCMFPRKGLAKSQHKTNRRVKRNTLAPGETETTSTSTAPTFLWEQFQFRICDQLTMSRGNKNPQDNSESQWSTDLNVTRVSGTKFSEICHRDVERSDRHMWEYVNKMRATQLCLSKPT